MEISALDTQEELELGDFDGGGLAVAAKGALASRAPSALSRRVFFDRVISRLRREVDKDLGEFHTRSHGHLLKVHFANERLHYEIWPDSRSGLIEVGLHFEDGPVSTAAFLRYFDSRIVELKHLLGTGVELERWTASWGHLYYQVPLAPFDARTATSAADLLVALINTVEPLVRAAAVPRERVDLPAERRRFQKRART